MKKMPSPLFLKFLSFTDWLFQNSLTFPWLLLKFQNSLTNFKIPWQFPDLEKIFFFPTFSLTVDTLSIFVPKFEIFSLYLYQNLWKYLKVFQCYWANTIRILKFTKGHNYVKTIGRVMQPFSAYHLMTLYICTKFQENISKGFRVIKQPHTEIYKKA